MQRQNGGGAPEGKASSSGSGGRRDEQQGQQGQGQQQQTVSVFGNDPWAPVFIFFLLMLSLLKAATQRCTC